MKAIWFTIRHLISIAISLFVIYVAPITLNVNYWATIPFSNEALGITKIVAAIVLWLIIASLAKGKKSSDPS